jgi:hypothetical protein
MNTIPFTTTLGAALLCLVLASDSRAQNSLGYDPNFGLDGIGLDSPTEAPPVFYIEILAFVNNEFNPTEEIFVPQAPHFPVELRNERILATPQSLQPSSADWYLDSLTLPRAPTAAVIPGPVTPMANPSVDEFGNTLTATPADAGNGRWYQLLDDDVLELGRAFARLNTLGAYTPLLHVAWSQAALAEDQAKPFDLGFLGVMQPSGTVQLHQSRFLHLTLDITLQNDYRYRQAPMIPGEYRPLREFMRPPQFRLATNRRVRSGELHFFDHPAFGVLITIRPAPEAAQPRAVGTLGPAA